jgi:hypothetical protein
MILQSPSAPAEATTTPCLSSARYPAAVDRYRDPLKQELDGRTSHSRVSPGCGSESLRSMGRKASFGVGTGQRFGNRCVVLGLTIVACRDIGRWVRGRRSKLVLVEEGRTCSRVARTDASPLPKAMTSVGMMDSSHLTRGCNGPRRHCVPIAPMSRRVVRRTSLKGDPCGKCW